MKKGRGKIGVIWKTWERCKSLGKQQQQQQSRSGWLSIYVGAGAEKERFVIKTKYVNHPLFKSLLEEAESEYGYSSEGPLLLPCEVDHFVEMLAEINHNYHSNKRIKGACTPHSSYSYLTPRLLADSYSYS